MNAVLRSLEFFFKSIPLPFLEVWGRFGFIVGFLLMIFAFGGFTFRPGGRWGFGREKQSWDAKAFLSMALTFVLIFLTGYLGSLIVLVPGAQTFESLKDLCVFLCILVFGYPALLVVPFAYGLSDLIEGVPPEFLADWWMGYFINPSCFWIAYQLIGRNPDFRKAVTWGWYFLFVGIFMSIEPQLWGYICSGKFTAEISYRVISPALFFTTSITWVLAPFFTMIVFPLARKYNLFWAEIPDHVREVSFNFKKRVWEKVITYKDIAESPRGMPIRIFLGTPFILLVLIMVGMTAYLTLSRSEEAADEFASRLHKEISENINLSLDQYLQMHPDINQQDLHAILKASSVAEQGRAFLIDENINLIASSLEEISVKDLKAVFSNDPVVRNAIMSMNANQKDYLNPSFQFRYDIVTAKPLSRETWLAQVTEYVDPHGRLKWKMITTIPASSYLGGVREGNSQSATVLAIALALSLVITALLAGVVAAPIRKISKASEAISQGDLSQRVPTTHLRELGALSGSFNHMAEQLQESFQKTKASEERFREVAETIQEVFWITNPHEEKVLYVSHAYEHVWGRTCESLYSLPMDWMRAIHPDDVQRVEVAVRERVNGKYHEEYRIIRPDGELRWIDDQGFAVRNQEGHVERIVGVARDITKQKNLEQHLLHAQRLESMGTLAGGIAHDFNNILMIISSYTAILRESDLELVQREKMIDVILNTTKRGASIVKQLLTLSKKTELSMQSVLIYDLIHEAITIVRETFPKNIQVAFALDAGDAKVKADSTQIHQVLVNLFVNARDAMPNGGHLTVAKRIVTKDVVEAKHPTANTTRYVEIQVIDTGTGIDETTQRRIFDPFFTTKEIGKGTGLGLALAYSIIENHKGFISVESILGRGTTFTIYLPVEENPEEEIAGVEEFRPTGLKNTEKIILLIEDEELLTEVMAFSLRNYGYRILMAPDGKEGIDLFAKHIGKIKIVVCDMGIPKINGLQVLQEIRHMDSTVSLILASGYIEPEVKADFEKLQFTHFLQKPFAIHDLLRIVELHDS